MENNIRVRTDTFEKLMEIEENRRNWEMLCSSDKPLVPFIGAGISAWCYPMWNALLQDVVKENFSEECAKIVAAALQSWEDKPDIAPEDFHWMEEIAEYIFDDDEDAFNKNRDCIKSLLEKGGNRKVTDGSEKQNANRILEDLHLYLGGYGVHTRRAAVRSLYKAFGIERLKKAGKIPEYQRFFPRLFQDLLVTTNYDKALEHCYPSIFSYSYSDLSEENGSDTNKESWLYRAVEEKLEQMQARLKGVDKAAGETVPDIPMLLKVHGSIEQASNIALSKSRYDEIYRGKMPELFGKICRRSSLLFMGCGLREDRILEELKKQKAEAERDGDRSFQHFAFYPAPEKAEEMEKQKAHFVEYGIYPIFYKKDVLSELYGGEGAWHSDCLGILLENLLRRKMRYHQPLEALWEKYRSVPLEMSGSIKNAERLRSINKGSQYVHVEEASQIWELLKSDTECPLIAVTGDTGFGKSTFCQSIQRLNKNTKDMMQFFYISLDDCKTWNEFCIQIYESLNIITPGIEGMEDYQTVAKQVEQRCSGYWRSVLIFDHLDGLKDDVAYPGQWDAIKGMLEYWKQHQTRVIFTARQYPEGIACHTWKIGSLTSQEAKKVFFSACTSRQYENSSLLDQNILDGLFSRQTFQQTFRPASAYLLGQYADSKNDLATLLDEWGSCHELGDSEEQTLARLIWNHLLDEHQWADKDDCEKSAIEENILWIWGILGSYPGIFPKAFLRYMWTDGPGYRDKTLSRKTLMFMKNAGLCEETIDEKYGFLLENMIRCARRFSDRIRSGEDKYKRLDVLQDMDIDGLKSFYGYTMDKYDGDLRRHTLAEWEKKREGICSHGKMDAAEDILHILRTLGEEVRNDEKRKCNKELNLVLHYEIKTVIRFLLTQLSRTDAKGDHKTRRMIAKTGCLFSHYYHYVPSHALPLVQRLLEIVAESIGDSGDKDTPEKFALYELADLHKVMGDIHRLLGRKEDAVTDHATAKKLCDEQMLLSFTDPDGIDPHRESQCIKAGVLLIHDHYGPDADRETEEAGAIYRRLGNEWGNAYYNQRKGETIYAEKPEPLYDTGHFEKVRKCYNAAAVHYSKVEDITGIAYILKCMGDLIGGYRNIYGQGSHTLWEAADKSAVYYQILAADEPFPGGREIAGSREDGIFAAACCYAQAFVYYRGHIDWRGFANVLQGMGNLLRYRLLAEKDTWGGKGRQPDLKGYEEPQVLYGAAEWCYRWLGDMRGLADTLDYAGHGYKEKGNAAAGYMALGKWMESREIWKWQGDDTKADKTAEEISRLRKKLNEDRWKEEHGDRAGDAR